jgi:hypothetical protein
MLALLATMTSFADSPEKPPTDGAVVAVGTIATTYVGGVGGAVIGMGAGFAFCPNNCGLESTGEDGAAALWAGAILGGLVGANMGAAGGAAGFALVKDHRPAVPAIVAGTTFASWTALTIGVGAFTKDLLGTGVPTEEVIALGGMAILPGVAAGIAVGAAKPQSRIVLRPAPTPGLGPGWVVAGTF